jgi:hypothetical protein
MTRDLLREVAEVYRANPDRPTTPVSGHFVVPHRTAARYVEQARAAGLLGPARRGKAGEHLAADEEH